ncbi:hypothetical protein [Pseudidiomarina sp.]|uniref:hypothetical protein n=1 Tax=Pseudidiomarina sp. TaxID=2081707 RepID=UPI00299DFEF8|nr:hypothetical protein [Pseudidiomarina sp.]MDX1706874.1 hypothetical protein [Pseudidiomarina sp.]
MNANQDASWCVTRPWFDYMMGTRVMSDPQIAESNPLGMDLPNWLESRVNRLARRLLPSSYESIDRSSRIDAGRRQEGIEMPFAGVA